MAFPLFVLAMGIVAALGNSVMNIVYATALVEIALLHSARACRGRTAAGGWLCRGRAPFRQRFQVSRVPPLSHALPSLAVQVSLNLGWALLNAAGLSFIGLGIQAPTAEWGIMVADGANFVVSGQWWMALFPGLAIMTTALCFNFLGDGLRDLLDPKRRT